MLSQSQYEILHPLGLMSSQQDQGKGWKEKEKTKA